MNDDGCFSGFTLGQQMDRQTDESIGICNCCRRRSTELKNQLIFNRYYHFID